MSIVLLVALCLPTVASAARVELVMDEPYAARSVAWPVTTGVPFPRGALANAGQCRLVDDRGQQQPLQARVAATWDAGTCVRWLTIDFIAQPGRKYAIEFGPEVQRPSQATPLAVDTPKLRIVTGPLAIDFSADGPAALKNISLDADRDGRFTAAESVAAGAAGGDHYYLDQRGRRFSSAGDGPERTIVVETAGPVRTCVRVDGFYTGPLGERIARYRTRYHFFAGLPLVKVVDELKFIGSTREVHFQDIGFALDLQLAQVGRRVTVEGANGARPLEIDWDGNTESVASYQAAYRHYGNPECVAGVARTTPSAEILLEESEQAGAWMQVADRQRAVTGSLRWFWQQFPKEWQDSGERLTLHLWSPRGGQLDFGPEGIERFLGAGGEKYLRSGQEAHNRNPLDRFFYHAEVDAIARGAADGLGVNKHHEFWLHFASAEDRQQGIEYGRLADRQPLALATGQWNCSTDVFGPLAARPNDSPYEAVVDRLFDLGRQAQSEFGDFGWWLFGAGPHYSYHWDTETEKFYADSRRFEFHTYGKETQLWWNYFRSGERKFYDWAIPSENHWIDIAVCHVPTTIECAWRGGKQEPRTLHWRPGEWGIDSPTHYVRHHDRAEAWLRGGAQFWASYHRTLETTTLAYYLTGDERFNDVVGYWRDYWADLAGKTSASADVQPWHRQQAWYKATARGEPVKTWAEMIRDYAPFGSGTRHNLTLLFNLATLYEHTWDERVGRALGEYADAFLDPEHPIGTWRPQDDRLPTSAEAPSMGHFWAPALWKYARVTRDERMPDILARYFDAAYAADPLRRYEHVGVYSNAYAGYAYYFMRDPRFLTLAASELDQLLPFAQPLASPQEINRRLYNPYAPIRAFAGVPRLVWALDEARRKNVVIAPPPARPQRTAIALAKPAAQRFQATLWGYDAELQLIGPDADAYPSAEIETRKYASQIQPFDRTMPGFEVYLHTLTIPADAPPGYYLVRPKLELAVLQTTHQHMPLWNAVRPLSLDAGEAVLLPLDSQRDILVLESASPAALRVRRVDGQPCPARVSGARAEVDLSSADGSVVIEANDKPVSFRIADWPDELCWVAAGAGATPLTTLPDRAATQAALPLRPVRDAEQAFVDGHFGQAVQVIAGRPLRVPDHAAVDGIEKPLFDRRQGTIEFWVRKQWDERLVPGRQANLLTNGLLTVPNRPNLPLDEWAHVALVWLPYDGDADQTITCLYIDGRDLANYRSLNWAGYSSPRPQPVAQAAASRKEFLSQALPGASWAIDELRISSTARYADPGIRFGPQQNFNPFTFAPPARPFAPDDDTLLLLHFDGHLDR